MDELKNKYIECLNLKCHDKSKKIFILIFKIY